MNGSLRTALMGKAAVIEQEGKSIRVLLHEGMTMYAVRDILAACGCKYPEKWCQREAKADSNVLLMKLTYPASGKSGGMSRRSYEMYFTNEECGRMILNIAGCDKGVREWMEREVFSCKLGGPEQKPQTKSNTSPKPATTPEAAHPGRTTDDHLNRLIDTMLFDLMELKKYISQPNM